MTENFDHYIDELIQFGLRYEPMDPIALNLKATEEFGELAEQVLYNSGYLQHKTLEEPIENELGDLLNCIIVTVAKILRDQGLNNEEIKERLLVGMFTKLDKYKRIIDEI